MGKTNQLRTYKDGVAIITGGAAGIGRSLGKALAKRGCRVVLADIDLDAAKETAKEIESSGGAAAAVKLDVTDKEGVKKVVQETFDKYGRIDYMFNNAGIAINGKFCDWKQDEWDKCININLLGVVYGTRAAYSIMEKQGFGHIINTASIAGIYPWPTTYAYAATKHAVVGMTTVLSAELVGTGIYASVLCPGTIRTAIIEDGARKERWAGEYSKEILEEFMAKAGGMSPDAFAKKAIGKIAKRKPIIAIPFSYKIYWLFYRLSPALGISISNKIYKIIMREIGGGKKMSVIDRIMLMNGNLYKGMCKIPVVGPPMARLWNRNMGRVAYITGAKHQDSIEGVKDYLLKTGEDLNFPFEIIEGTETSDSFEFFVGYCPYGFKNKDHQVPCDAAMEMDRVLFKNIGADLIIKETVVDGAPKCRLLMKMR